MQGTNKNWLPAYIIAPSVDMHYLPPNKINGVDIKDLIDARQQYADAINLKQDFVKEHAQVLDDKRIHDTGVRESERTLRALHAEYNRMAGAVHPQESSKDTPPTLPSMLKVTANKHINYDNAEMLQWCIDYMPAVLAVNTKLLDTMLRAVLPLKTITFPTPPPAILIRAISPEISEFKGKAFKAVKEDNALSQLSHLHDCLEDLTALEAYVKDKAPELHAHFEAYSLQDAQSIRPIDSTSDESNDGIPF